MSLGNAPSNFKRKHPDILLTCRDCGNELRKGTIAIACYKKKCDLKKQWLNKTK